MDIIKEEQEQSLTTSIATGSYLAYRREVDYRGLNEAVTIAIYHTIRNVGCIRR